jgi:hypothetical protein
LHSWGVMKKAILAMLAAVSLFFGAASLAPAPAFAQEGGATVRVPDVDVDVSDKGISVDTDAESHSYWYESPIFVGAMIVLGVLMLLLLVSALKGRDDRTDRTTIIRT